MSSLKTYRAIKQSLGLMLMSVLYAPALFADENPFPKFEGSADITSGNALTKIANMLKLGGSLMLFMGCIVAFVKFMSTVSHGIELSKKNEGSLTDFTSYMLMSIVYLVLCIGAGYMGFAVITKFKIQGA